MSEDETASCAELWFQILRSKVFSLSGFMRPLEAGTILFQRDDDSRIEALGALRSSASGVQDCALIDPPDCTVIVLESGARSFALGSGLPSGAIRVSGKRGLFDGVLNALDDVPKRRSLLDLRSGK